MIHERGICPIEVQWLTKHITYGGPGFLKEAGCRRIIPQASSPILRLRELEMTGRSSLQCITGIHHGAAILESD